MMRPENDVDDLTLPRHLRGWIGHWPHRIKAFALLTLLAVASALASGGNAGADTRSRDSVSTGGALRASALDAPALLAAAREQQHEATDGDIPPPPSALSPIGPALPRPPASLIGGTGDWGNGWVVHRRPGHTARMPTGPPTTLSV